MSSNWTVCLFFVPRPPVVGENSSNSVATTYQNRSEAAVPKAKRKSVWFL